MADDQNKNTSTTGTANADAGKSGPSNTGTPAASTPSEGTPAANVGTSKQGASPDQGVPASPAGGRAATGATATTGAASGATTPNQPRPVTTTPAPGGGTTDRLSLDPERPSSTLDRAKVWVEENPALAVLGAVALGLVIGRAVVAAIPEPEPKTLTGKIEKRAKELAEHGRYYAGDAGEVISKQLVVASEALGEAAKVVAKNAKHGYKEAKDFSESVAEAVGHAFSKKATEWLEKMEKMA